MALSDKNIIITPNIGSVNDPKIVFSGADTSTAAQNITLTAYPTNGGTLSFDGSTGQLFSVTNSMSGTIFSANDVSGIPSIEVIDTGLVKLAQYSGNVLLGTGTDTGLAKLQVTGSVSLTGNILHSPTGRSIYGPNPTWSSYLYVGGDGVNGISRTGSIGSIVTTNGNIHIDSGSDKGTYLNLYSGASGIYFGNGAGSYNATMSTGGLLTAAAVTLTNGGTGSNGPLAVSGDATVYRSATGGVLYFGSNRNNYIQYDGSNYYLGGSGGLYVGGNVGLTAANYTSYSPTLTGGSASGTWGISITGNAASASALSTSGTISSYMSDVGVLFQSYNASAGNAAQFNITHSYGAVTISNVRGALTLNGTATNATTAANLSTTSSIKRTVAGAGWLDGGYPTYETVSTSGAIYSIGGSYVPGTTSLGNMYGIGYGYSGHAGITATGAPNDQWGMYAASAGTSRIFLNSDDGSGYFNGSLYAGGIKVPTISIQDTAPTGTTGSFWWQSSTGKLKIYYNDGTSSQWVDAVPIPDTSTFYSKAGGAITGPIVANSSLTVSGNTNIAGVLSLGNNLTQNTGSYVYPGSASGLSNNQTSYYLSSHVSWGIYTNTSFNAAGGVYDVGNRVLSSATFNSYSPTLTGGSASGTWDISITGNAATVGSLSVHAGTNNEANKIVRSDTNGYINVGWINTLSGDSGIDNRLTRIYSSNDGYLRYSTLTDFKVHMGLSAKNNYSRRIDYSASANYHVGSMGHNLIGANEVFHGGSGFIDIWSGTNYPGSTTHIQGFNALHYTEGSYGTTGSVAYGIQVAGQYDAGGELWSRGCSVGNFSAWRKQLDSSNYNSYSPTLTGGSASGTWGISVTGSAASATYAYNCDSWFNFNNNYGHAVEGIYNAGLFQGMFDMGPAYRLTAGGGVGNLYGTCWSHPNAGGAAANLDSHGQIVLINGGFGSCMSYSIKASANVTAYSDERLKTNWKPLADNFVEKLANIKVGTYDRIDQSITQVGVSAQSLETLLPEAVITGNDEMQTKSVAYGNAALAATVMLAREFVEMKQMIKELKAEIAKLKEDTNGTN